MLLFNTFSNWKNNVIAKHTVPVWIHKEKKLVSPDFRHQMSNSISELNVKRDAAC